MKTEKKLAVANWCERWCNCMMGPLCVGSIGLVPAAFIGLWCMLGTTWLENAAAIASFLWFSATMAVFFTVIVVGSIGNAFRESWWRATEDPWRVWQVDHYGKVVD